MNLNLSDKKSLLKTLEDIKCYMKKSGLSNGAFMLPGVIQENEEIFEYKVIIEITCQKKGKL